MKRLLLTAMSALCFIAASGQRTVYGPPFESDPEKGLYVGAAEYDILLGQHNALAMALQEFIFVSSSQFSGIQYSMSSSKTADQSDPEETSTLTNKGSCDIEMVDRTIVNGIEYIMFKIISGGKYEYEVSEQGSILTNGNQSDEINDSLISLSYTDPAKLERVVWRFAMSSQTVRKGSVTISDHVEILCDIYYEKDK